MKYCLLIITCFFVTFPFLCFAQGDKIEEVVKPPKVQQQQGVVTLDNPLKADSPQALIGKIIHAVLGIVGSLALAMFIYGGFTWMLAGGSPESVKKGKDTLLWASLGLVIIFTSYALVKFVLDAVTK